MSMLNALFDKSPEEIMSDIKSPVFTWRTAWKKKWMSLQGVDISKFGPDAFPNLQPNIKLNLRVVIVPAINQSPITRYKDHNKG
ncbi:unnamed protein product [Callosobruchus maculatus]|uniref:Uncharacterized protein n=1 Tax=Callosobruchus maculatus TaxID=64391 RepID=A0A653D359_CALMS|nr:unnamed protein product [Callosobruchus maculatus]